MKKFEYKTYTFAYMEADSIVEADIKALNKLSAQGWEVISVVPVKLWKQGIDGYEKQVVIMKRELENKR